MSDEMHLEIEEPYAGFRARVREAFSSIGWELMSSDEEADFFAKGALSVYASPADGVLDFFHTVVIMRYASEEARRQSDCSPGPEPVEVERAYSVEEAVRVATEMLQRHD